MNINVSGPKSQPVWKRTHFITILARSQPLTGKTKDVRRKFTGRERSHLSLQLPCPCHEGVLRNGGITALGTRYGKW